ncbi:hypothetical protein [Indioceanicola profundi]|uniref:hypothetical protein n=1 Tax=Indioceanicola profundi TaxID=2220096 RepID=UPI000E6AC126|nr:hypothetical protein [Indioceanicola profundi]
MGDTYVTLKVREALRSAGGSRGQAQRILIAMALEDEQLLRGLAQPFLKAIAGSAVERVARATKDGDAVIARSSAPVAASRGSARPQRRLSPTALDALVAQIGQGERAPLANAASGAEVSPDQASAMKTLAAAFRSRK